MMNKKELVVWRNYEASYDVAQLEPKTPRLLFTYVLQEYFVPVGKFDEFIPKMRTVFKKYNANIINVSIRHAQPDPGTYLAWAPEEVFSFVVYYKQATTNAAKKKVAIWTREMIDQVLSVGGRYYLPYQIHATDEQFKKAYPGYEKYFELKKKLDPTNKFRNKLWDKYYN
ncbi:D-arabinono-1,4-lactone oxidase [compost metagenome]